MKGTTTLLLVGGVGLAVGALGYVLAPKGGHTPTDRPHTSDVGTGSKNGTGDYTGQLIAGVFDLGKTWLTTPHPSGNAGSGGTKAAGTKAAGKDAASSDYSMGTGTDADYA